MAIFSLWNFLFYGTGIRVISSSTSVISNDHLFIKFQDGNIDTLFYGENIYSKDWDADPSGHLWVAAGEKLVHVFNQNVTVYDSTNSPIGEDEFLHIKLGSNGHVWLGGNTNYIYEFDGSDWIVHQYYTYNYFGIENLTLDEQNNPWLITHSGDVRRLYELYNNSWTYHYIPFRPLRDVKAVGINTTYSGKGYFATDEGFFSINLATNSLFSFYDSTDYAYAEILQRLLKMIPENIIFRVIAPTMECMDCRTLITTSC